MAYLSGLSAAARASGLTGKVANALGFSVDVGTVTFGGVNTIPGVVVGTVTTVALTFALGTTVPALALAVSVGFFISWAIDYVVGVDDLGTPLNQGEEEFLTEFTAAGTSDPTPSSLTSEEAAASEDAYATSPTTEQTAASEDAYSSDEADNGGVPITYLTYRGPNRGQVLNREFFPFFHALMILLIDE